MLSVLTRKQTNSTKGQKAIFEGDGCVVIVLRRFAYIQNDQFVYIKCVHFLYSNYTSIKLLEISIFQSQIQEKTTECKIYYNNPVFKKLDEFNLIQPLKRQVHPCQRN